MDYIKLTFEYDRDLEEAFSLRLADSAAIGSQILDLKVVNRRIDGVEEWELVDPEELRHNLIQAGGPEDDRVIIQEVFFENTAGSIEALTGLIADLADLGPSVRLLDREIIGNDHWEEEWKKHYSEQAIGNDLLVLPAWFETPETDRVLVRIEPGMAFGTGTHETTVLCLEELECLVMEDLSLLDMGCGSGILSIYAKLKGADAVDAVDIDRDALRSCKHNAALNGVDLTCFSSDLFASIDRSYDIICANLLADLVIRMLDEADDHLNEGGQLILSGILVTRADSVQRKLEEEGFVVLGRRDRGEWTVFRASRRGEG